MPKKRKKSLKKNKAKEVKKRPALPSDTKKGIILVICFALALLSLLSFVGVAGIFGRYFTQASKFLFGAGFFLVTVVFLLAGLAIIQPSFKKKTKKTRPPYRAVLIGIIIFLLSVLGIFHLFSPEDNSGGYFGLALGYPLTAYFGFWAGMVVLLALLIISILIIFNISLLPQKKDEEEQAKEAAVAGSGEESQKQGKKSLWQKFKSGAEEKKSKDEIAKKEEAGGQEEVIGGGGNQEEPASENVSDSRRTAAGAAAATGFDLKQKRMMTADYKGPSLDFLQPDSGQPTSGDIKANINIVKRTLDNFGIQVEMAEVNVGPTVTQYTLRPAQGIKLARITALQNDLALALAAHPLRIEAPIPGRSLVGIEIPNRSIVMVRLRSLLERPAFQESAGRLTFAVGRDVAGNPIFANLTQMPHMLVAGATGTGKTVALNNLIVSLLYGNSPDNMRFILIDPKRVELSIYEGIPHLLSPVIVNADKAIGALRWAVSEMERRFGLLQEAGKRDIGSYNSLVRGKKSSQNQEESLPYIVIVIDELADLMSSHGREVEGAIVRLAQMARAVGIHLVVSTQRPSVEVITGLIKANITSRMAFQVASQVDSRTILDTAGAEKLLGNGDMLFVAGNSAKPRRTQGAYLEDKEVRKVADYLRQLAQPEYKEEVTEIAVPSAVGGGEAGLGGGEESSEDELYGQAKEIVIQSGKASASLLQRRLRIGYARAARLLDILEENGVIGPGDGAKPRKVFIDQGAEKEIE